MGLAIDTLAYARRLREAGFTEQQAEGQASALAAAMTDSLATKQDLRELEGRIDARFLATKQDLRELEGRIDARFLAVDARFVSVDARFVQLEMLIAELEKRIVLQLDGKLATLEHRMTLRLGGITVAGIGLMSALLELT